MIIHILRDIAQEASSDAAHAAERNADQVDVLICGRIRYLTGIHDHLRASRNGFDGGDFCDRVEERGPGQCNDFSDDRGVGDVELLDHNSADIVGGGWDEFAGATISEINSGQHNDSTNLINTL